MAGASIFRSAATRRVVLIANVVAWVLSACSSGSSNVQLSAVARATSASSARVRVTYAFDGQEFSTDGVADFDNRVSRTVTVQADGKHVVTISAGGRSYVGLNDPPETGPAWIRMPALPEAVASEAMQERSADPSALIERLRQSKAGLTKSGERRLHDAHTTTYTFALNESDAKGLFGTIGTAKGQLDVDDERRLRRFELTPLTGADDERVPLDHIVWELWDYGVKVDVKAPTDRVVDAGEPAANDLMSRLYGTPTDLAGLNDTSPDDLIDLKVTGPFAQIAGGAWQSEKWSVWEAPTTEDDIFCMTFELDPAPPGTDDWGFPDIPGEITHDGHPASCSPHSDLFEMSDPLSELDSSYTGDYWYFAGTAAPELTTVEFTFSDGTKRSVPVDPTSHVFVLFDSEHLKPKKLRPSGGPPSSITCSVEKDWGLNCSGSYSR